MDIEFEQTQGDSGGRKPGVLQSMGSQRVGQDLSIEQQHAYTRKALANT